jgi:hypothetical protein
VEHNFNLHVTYEKQFFGRAQLERIFPREIVKKRISQFLKGLDICGEVYIQLYTNTGKSISNDLHVTLHYMPISPFIDLRGRGWMRVISHQKPCPFRFVFTEQKETPSRVFTKIKTKAHEINEKRKQKLLLAKVKS